MVYFLALLGVALGVVSLLVYRLTSQTLQAKRAATEQLLETQYRENCDKERAHLDEVLLSKARTASGLVSSKPDPRLEALFRFQGEFVRGRYREMAPVGL